MEEKHSSHKEYQSHGKYLSYFIISPTLFAVYKDELLLELWDFGVGCHVADMFMGALGYCDDILLIAPTRRGMEMMLKCCEMFAEKNNLIFSINTNPKKSKTMCLFVRGKSKNLLLPSNLQLYGVDLPWVETATHLGRELTS